MGGIIHKVSIFLHVLQLYGHLVILGKAVAVEIIRQMYRYTVNASLYSRQGKSGSVRRREGRLVDADIAFQIEIHRLIVLVPGPDNAHVVNACMHRPVAVYAVRVRHLGPFFRDSRALLAEQHL